MCRYLLIPETLARTANVSIEEINDFFTTHSLALTGTSIFDSDVSSTIYNCETKEIISEGDSSFCHKFNKNKYDIIKNLTEPEICEDIKTLINHVTTFFV